MPIVFVNGPFHRRAMRKVGWICGRDPVRSPCLERCDNLIGDANDGAVEYGRGRELLTPERAFGIDGGQIPKNSIRKTTIRLWLRLEPADPRRDALHPKTAARTRPTTGRARNSMVVRTNPSAGSVPKRRTLSGLYPDAVATSLRPRVATLRERPARRPADCPISWPPKPQTTTQPTARPFWRD